MITRENLKLLVVAVACLLVAWTGPSLAHGVHARFAHNADKVDGRHAVGAGASLANARGKLVAHNGAGRLPAKFLPGSLVTEGEYRGRHTKIVTTHGGSGWRGGSATVTPAGSRSFASTGSAILPLQAPLSVGGVTVGLEQVEICYSASASNHIGATFANATDTPSKGDVQILNDQTDRTSPTHACYALQVGKRVLYGAAVSVIVSDSGGPGGAMLLGSVRATWSTASATVAP